MPTTRRSANTVRMIGACALIASAGCFKLARPTPPLEEYVLGGGAKAVPAVPSRDTGGVTIGLRRLDLAPYLATTAIVVRYQSRIVTSGFRRWAEDPGAGLMRTVAVSLGAAPGIRAVDVAPWAVRAPHDYIVQLHVSNLEGVAEDSTATQGEAHVMASWEVIRARDGAVVARGVTDRREAGWKVGDYAGLVTRFDKGLNGLATDVAACVARLAPLVPTTELQPAAELPRRCDKAP